MLSEKTTNDWLIGRMLKEKLLPICENRALLVVKEKIEEVRCRNKKFIIWGAGSSGQCMLDFLNKNYKGIMPEYIVDNNEGVWDGKKYKSPQDFILDRDKIDVVFICVYVADQVKQQIISMGYSGEIVFVAKDAFRSQDDLISFYEDNLDKIEKVYSMLDDDLSRKTVETFINVVRTGDISMWDSVNGNSEHKLVDPTVLDFSSEDHLVDVGAFIGDTLHELLCVNDRKYRKITCFEPDERNYGSLVCYIKGNRVDNCKAMQFAVGKESGKVMFRGGASESCGLSEAGNVIVDAVTLDSVDDIQDATFLKFSTSGYEMNAIVGAKEIIKKNKPKIATYISEDQLWKIPILLKELVPEYKLYIRHYGVGLQAMACYAVL